MNCPNCYYETEPLKYMNSRIGSNRTVFDFLFLYGCKECDMIWDAKGNKFGEAYCLLEDRIEIIPYNEVVENLRDRKKRKQQNEYYR